jgi:poly-gamma-glutamate synthesis protein (capsule biosynthesis protein)
MEKITIGLAGDVMLGRTLDMILSKRGYSSAWGNLLPHIKETDFNLINLENAFTHSNKKVYKTFNFKATPDKVQTLLNANVKVVNLANNHILDYSEEGLIETINTLDEASIIHVGAGNNSKEANSPVIINRKGIRIGILGFTDNEPTWNATTKPGVNYVNVEVKKDRDRILKSIESLKKESDVIFITIHWGPNMVEKPSIDFIQFAHAMVEHGADLIHGHSAHILQGIEFYKKSLILYDTGDFVDDYAVDPDLRNDLTAFYMLTINKSGIEHLKIIPARIFDYQVNLARNKDYEWVISRLNQLSADFKTTIDFIGNVKTNIPQTIHN